MREGEKGREEGGEGGAEGRGDVYLLRDSTNQYHN